MAKLIRSTKKIKKNPCRPYVNIIHLCKVQTKSKIKYERMHSYVRELGGEESIFQHLPTCYYTEVYDMNSYVHMCTLMYT